MLLQPDSHAKIKQKSEQASFVKWHERERGEKNRFKRRERGDSDNTNNRSRLNGRDRDGW
jgi:hypothetical protein